MEKTLKTLAEKRMTMDMADQLRKIGYAVHFKKTDDAGYHWFLTNAPGSAFKLLKKG